MVPAFATIEAPPDVREREATVYDGAKWAIVPDYRGEVRYDPETGQGFTVDVFGVEPVGPAEPPAHDLYRARWNGEKWVGEPSPELAPTVEDRLTALQSAILIKGLLTEAEIEAAKAVQGELKEKI